MDLNQFINDGGWDAIQRISQSLAAKWRLTDTQREEIVSDTLHKLVQQQHRNGSITYDPTMGRPEPWLSKIMHRMTLRHLKRTTQRQRHETPLSGQPETASGSDHDPAHPLEQTELRDTIESASSQLPPALKSVFQQRYLHQKKFQDIAYELRIGLVTAHRKWNQALEWLADELNIFADRNTG